MPSLTALVMLLLRNKCLYTAFSQRLMTSIPYTQLEMSLSRMSVKRSNVPLEGSNVRKQHSLHHYLPDIDEVCVKRHVACFSDPMARVCIQHWEVPREQRRRKEVGLVPSPAS